jgi:hypothetical protein
MESRTCKHWQAKEPHDENSYHQEKRNCGTCKYYLYEKTKCKNEHLLKN